MQVSNTHTYTVLMNELLQITDYPQILSGTTIVYFDPQHTFSEGGYKFDGEERSADQIAAFQCPCLPPVGASSYPGTIVRLPLRRKKSRLGERIEESTIRNLVDGFIKHELQDVLLFLNYVTTVKVFDIAADGTMTQLACIDAQKQPWTTKDEHANTICTVSTSFGGRNEVTEVAQWSLLMSQYPDTKASSSFSAEQLSTHKIRPEIGLAACLSAGALAKKSGRLYTYLPLPLMTGFPVHVHGLFALTQSRQHLRNANEMLVVGSTDR